MLFPRPAWAEAVLPHVSHCLEHRRRGRCHVGQDDAARGRQRPEMRLGREALVFCLVGGNARAHAVGPVPGNALL